jgi:starch-binding outer membrane protein, SusD/RagB family
MLNFKRYNIMNTNIFKIISIGMLVALLMSITTGCDDFLEENPKNFISPDAFYQNRGDVESALAGIYSSFVDSWRSMYRITWTNNNDSENYYPASLSVPGFISWTADNGGLDNLWELRYEGIKRANDFLFRMADIESNVIPDDLKNRMIGEAKFIRALNYYWLASYWGDVPLITEPYNPAESPLVEREEESVVWEFLLSDLREAANALPLKSDYSGSDVSRINKHAAMMLAAKIAMIQNNWPEAKSLVDEIISSNQFALETDITHNWELGMEHSIESIFEIDFAADMTPRLGNVFHNHTAPGTAKNPLTGKAIPGGKWGGGVFSKFLYDSFEDTDERKLKLLWPLDFYEGESEGRYYTTKYWDFATMERASFGQGPVNLVYFRYADLLLMRAEIENEIAGGPNEAAYNAINQVRNRSKATDLEPGLNYEEFLHAIFDERNRELFYEGHDGLELKRRSFAFVESRVESKRRELFEWVGFEGKFDFQEHHMYYPIPQSQLDANPKLTQNPGY